MYVIMALICGWVMSAGLILSGMVNPAKVIGFLDVSGAFDPTLAFVMAGALAVTFIGYRLIGQSKPLLCANAELAKNNKIDKPLIIGAAMFGTGWGLAGFCPAPALVGIGSGISEATVFVMAMLAGMGSAKLIRGDYARK